MPLPFLDGSELPAFSILLLTSHHTYGSVTALHLLAVSAPLAPKITRVSARLFCWVSFWAIMPIYPRISCRVDSL